MSETQSNGRLHALDAVRGLALCAGVMFHALGSFLPSETPVWIVTDEAPSTSLAVAFYVLHIFRMTAFFLIAGLFARMMVERRGVGGFVKDRARRIALPLAVFWPPLFAAIVAVAIWGAVTMADGGPLPPTPKPPPGKVLPFPLTHLWFLYLLLILYAVALPVRGVFLADRSGRLMAGIDRAVGALIGGWWAPAVLALPLAAALFAHDGWILWGGIPAPDNSLVPNLPALVGYGAAFAFGWLIHRRLHRIGAWARTWPATLAIAVGCTAAALAMVGLTPSDLTLDRGPRKLAYAGLYATAVWSWTISLTGLALRFLSAERPQMRYLADASYWIYLAHLPLVMALQVAVSELAWPWPAKLAAILLVAFPILLASYHLLVRHTWLGAWLNGRRHPRPSRIPANSSAQEPAT